MNKHLAFIIEDENDLAMIFARALDGAGFSTERILTGDAAMKRLREAVPDVVILDLHLPNVSGLEILQAIRADERLAKTRVIVASADARMSELTVPQADLVLIKPVSFIQLRDLAARLAGDQQ